MLYTQVMRCSALQAARVRVQVNNTAAIREATQTATSIASNWVAYAVAQARARLQPTSRAAERETSNPSNFYSGLQARWREACKPECINSQKQFINSEQRDLQLLSCRVLNLLIALIADARLEQCQHFSRRLAGCEYNKNKAEFFKIAFV